MRSMFAPRQIQRPTPAQIAAAKANARSSDAAHGMELGQACLGNIQTPLVHRLKCAMFQSTGESAPFLALVAVCSSSGNAFGYKTHATEVTCKRCLAARG